MNSLEQFRAEKDEFFASHPQSPLTPEQKQNFDGLKYFPENPNLRFEIEILKYHEKEQILIQTSTGEGRVYTRFGKISFTVASEDIKLTRYENEHGLFLPFVDSLANIETYGAGRYLEPEALPNGKYLVDFNLAYNPYCAYIMPTVTNCAFCLLQKSAICDREGYNEYWSCPLTPLGKSAQSPHSSGRKNLQKIPLKLKQDSLDASSRLSCLLTLSWVFL